jgi:hypothetical protein
VSASVFLAVGIYWSTLAYAQLESSTEVRPAAAIRNGDTTRGFFIAETSTQIYLGRKRFDDPRGAIDVNLSRLIVFSKDEVSDLAIGPLMNPEFAFRRAKVLARELCAVRLHDPVPEIAEMSADRRTQCDRLMLKRWRHKQEGRTVSGLPKEAKPQSVDPESSVLSRPNVQRLVRARTRPLTWLGVRPTVAREWRRGRGAVGKQMCGVSCRRQGSDPGRCG